MNRREKKQKESSYVWVLMLFILRQKFSLYMKLYSLHFFRTQMSFLQFFTSKEEE